MGIGQSITKEPWSWDKTQEIRNIVWRGAPGLLMLSPLPGHLCRQNEEGNRLEFQNVHRFQTLHYLLLSPYWVTPLLPWCWPLLNPKLITFIQKNEKAEQSNLAGKENFGHRQSTIISKLMAWVLLALMEKCNWGYTLGIDLLKFCAGLCEEMVIQLIFILAHMHQDRATSSHLQPKHAMTKVSIEISYF